MSALTVVALAVGFLLLIAGGELLVRGASGLAGTLGISPLVVGLTVVAFATSTPELAVSIDAALSGHPGLAVGNVVGSNIANILLILGLTAMIAPLVADSRIVRVDIPIMVAFSLVLLVVALDGVISSLNGLLLLIGMVGYVVATVVVSRGHGSDLADSAGLDDPAGAPQSEPEIESADDGHASDDRTPHAVLKSSALVGLGVLMLVIGARLLVDAASTLASAWGMSDLVIGLTVVAIGTSLPELATSLVAAYRGERDLAVGNIVGSNVFNVGAVLGITSLITPIEVASGAVRFDLPIMLAVALALLPIAFTGMAITRWEGLFFTGFYGAYLAFVVIKAADHDALEPYSAAMLWFVIPVSALWIVLLGLDELGVLPARRQARRSPRDRTDLGKRRPE